MVVWCVGDDMSKISPCGDCILVKEDKIIFCPYLIVEDGVTKCGRKDKELSRVIKDTGETV